jgi:hypothetical protein
VSSGLEASAGFGAGAPVAAGRDAGSGPITEVTPPPLAQATSQTGSNNNIAAESLFTEPR